VVALGAVEWCCCSSRVTESTRTPDIVVKEERWQIIRREEADLARINMDTLRIMNERQPSRTSSALPLPPADPKP